jgi:hypothetical protein
MKASEPWLLSLSFNSGLILEKMFRVSVLCSFIQTFAVIYAIVFFKERKGENKEGRQYQTKVKISDNDNDAILISTYVLQYA